MTRKEALIGALRKLRAKPELSDEALESLTEIAADKLSLMAGPHRDAAPAAFRNASMDVADSQKKKIEHLARQLADAVEGMNKPTVLAFAEVGVPRTQMMLIASEIRRLSIAANQAKIDPQKIDDRTGRAKKGPTEVIRRIVADYYFVTTGKIPSGDGAFLALSREIISLLNLDDKPSGFAKLAYQDFQRRNRAAT